MPPSVTILWFERKPCHSGGAESADPPVWRAASRIGIALAGAHRHAASPPADARLAKSRNPAELRGPAGRSAPPRACVRLRDAGSLIPDADQQPGRPRAAPRSDLLASARRPAPKLLRCGSGLPYLIRVFGPDWASAWLINSRFRVKPRRSAVLTCRILPSSSASGS